jgi:predicted nucleic acid-binding protein
VGALIDSSVLVAAERGELDLDAVLEDHAETDFALSAITASELLHGVHRPRSEALRASREACVEVLLSRFPVIAFDSVSARTHARLWAGLAAKGANIGVSSRDQKRDLNRQVLRLELLCSAKGWT